MRQAYITITVPAEAEFTEKKSRFIGAICPIADENQAQLFLAKRRSLHRDARHHVYAWLLGDNCQVERFSDDGEPMGTGGRPALAVLKQAGLQNVAVV
ncbi:MAG: YigZ family protein, partial [Clostridiales bacterium]